MKNTIKIVWAMMMVISQNAFSDVSERRLFNDAKTVEIEGLGRVSLQQTDESWRTSTEPFSAEAEEILIRSKRVIFLSYSLESGLSDQDKIKIVADSLSECGYIKSLLLREQRRIGLEEGFVITSVNYLVPSTTVNTINPDRVSMRCHININAILKR